jgi:hypothetical protein
MVRAYYLSQQDPDDPQAHWLRAETETIHAAFVNGRAASRGRLDPSRE